MMLYFIMFFAVIIFFVWKGTKGPARTIEQLKQAITDLDNRGFNHSTLVVDKLFSKRFVQFRKIVDEGGSNIQLSFPNAKWSETYFLQIVSLAESEKLSFYILEGEQSDQMLFIHINFARDIDLAHRIMKAILLDVFKEDINGKFYVLLNNADLDSR